MAISLQHYQRHQALTDSMSVFTNKQAIQAKCWNATHQRERGSRTVFQMMQIMKYYKVAQKCQHYVKC